jgi:predicted nucleotidyltransferase
MPKPYPPQLNQITQELKGIKPRLYEQWGVTELAVFGSVSRGEATLESDVDIMFNYDKPLGLEIVMLADFLEDVLGYKVDLLSKKAIRQAVWSFIEGEMVYV